jgi:beta-phosphoglucomutase
MLDTDPLHFAAYQQLLASYDRSITEHYYKTEIMGAPIDHIMANLFPRLSGSERTKLGERKEELFREQLTGPLVAREGLCDLVTWARESGLGICVVTNAPSENAEMMLRGLGLRDRIDDLLIGSELARSKPDPFPYQEGMRRLGVDADHAVAFEDSGPGVRSASSAGLFTFGMMGALDAEALREQGASAVLEDFNEHHLWEKLGRIAPAARQRPS